MPRSAIIFGVLVVTVAVAVALMSADSGTDWPFLLVIPGGPIFVTACLIAVFQTIRAIRTRALKIRTLLACSAGLALVTVAVYGGIWRWLHPLKIHYKFDYGQSGTWHEVQFTHTGNAREIEGPWVGGWPLSVRFPDLNNDGWPDISVVGNDRIAEYVYLPHNDGKCFWHLVRNDGFFVSYSPDGHWYP